MTPSEAVFYAVDFASSLKDSEWNNRFLEAINHQGYKLIYWPEKTAVPDREYVFAPCPTSDESDKWPKNSLVVPTSYNLLPDFYSFLIEAEKASEDVDYFDLHSEDPESKIAWNKLLNDRTIIINRLLDFVYKNYQELINELNKK